MGTWMLPRKDVLNQLPSKRRQRVLLDKLSNDGGSGTGAWCDGMLLEEQWIVR